MTFISEFQAKSIIKDKEIKKYSSLEDFIIPDLCAFYNIALNTQSKN